MKVVIYTVDCFKERARLMPWRTILEVAKVMQEAGHKVAILNACNKEEDAFDYEWAGIDGLYKEPVQIRSVLKTDEAVLIKLNELGPQSLYIPLTFREGIKPAKWIEKVTCKKIGYMAGGVYDLKSAWLLIQTAGLAVAKPYLLEALTSYRLFAHTMKQIGISKIIGLTDTTTNSVKRSGFINALTIYPGKDPFDAIPAEIDIIKKYGLLGKKWFLFSGAPAPARGAELLLKAIDRVKDETVRLVMLMRTDVGSVYKEFESKLETLKHPERVIVIREKLTREQLRAFFCSAWYALLPFIVIPSEVPLTFFELLCCGTPVITFKNGGTTDYLHDGLLISDKSLHGLTDALEHAWKDARLRDNLSNNGKRIMSTHPTWEEVGKQWEKLLSE